MYNLKMEDIISVNDVAYKLLMDQSIDKALIQLMVVDDLDNQYDKLAVEFEVLISIFMEMVIYILKVKYVNENNKELNESNLENYNLEFDIDDLDFFKTKFSKIGYQLCIHDVGDYYDTLYDYYCKTLFKKDNEYYFMTKKIDNEYTFLLRNDKYKNFTKLNDFYTKCFVDNKYIQVYFDKI
tara:strand:+ start:55 stop:600 length:546 start_codon:yes stop_codon:yes gene_type:complete